MKTAPAPVEVLARLVRAQGAARAGWALDVGALAGEFARSLARTGLFAGVLAFEPNPANAAALEALAAAEPRVKPVRSAVGEREGAAVLHCDGDLATGSLLDYRPGYASRGAVARFDVPVVTLDACRTRVPLAGERVALLKVDTQGHDLAVLRGARELIRADRPILMVELIHVPLYEGQSQPEAIARFAAEAGYVLYSLSGIHATVEGRLAFADAIYAPVELELPATQEYVQLDNSASYEEQIATLQRICQERLDAINVLDAEVRRLGTQGALR